MAIGPNIQALLTSHGAAGSFNNRLATQFNTPAVCTFNIVTDVKRSDRFTSQTGGATMARNTKGLRSISGSYKGYVSTTPRIGSTGLFTFGTYGGFCTGYEVNINCPAKDVTLLGATEWRSYCAGGPVEWGFTAQGFQDSATALPGAGLDAEPATATFQISATKSLSGSAITTSISADADPTKVGEWKMTGVGDGFLGTAGAASELWVVDAGSGVYSVTTPLYETMTLVSAGTTYVGLAGNTGINLKVVEQDLIEITVNWQGSGAWTGFTGV